MTSSFSLHSLAVANAAMALVSVNSGVRGAVGMALRAACLCSLPVVRAVYIYGMSNQLKVLGVNTVVNATKMIPFESRGGPATKKMMSQRGAALVPEPPVALSVEIANPQHAAVRTAWINVLPEALARGKMSRHREPQLSGVMQPDVDASRLPLILQEQVS